MKKSFSLFIAMLLLACLSILFSTCAKEYSYEGGPMSNDTIPPPPPPPPTPDAGFSLAGSPADCTTPSIKGEYIVDNPLGPNNQVEVIVDVASVGRYHIYTDTLDGISFSGSGTFTKTGV